jgi:hypothetical protein
MVGSGVILVALHKNKVYYLFGKEGSMERDKKCHWGDFGGGAKPGEDLLDTTTREGAEELNGFFGSKVDFEKYILKNKIDEVAYDKRYTYLVKADYDEKLPYYFNNNGTPVNQYVLPLMTSYSAYPTVTSSYSMAFGLEYSVRGDAPVNTLYLMYWNEYLSRMYSTQSRLVKMTGIVPVGEWLNFELNDTIAISGNYYKVQSVKYDMLTEIANLELITYPDVDIMSFTTTGQKPDFTDVVVNVNGKSYLQDYVVAKGIMNSYRFGTQDYLNSNQDTTFNQNSVSDLAQQVDSLQAIVQFNQITMYRETSVSSTTEGTTWIPVPQELEVSIGYVDNITSDLATAKYICTDGGQYKFTAMVEVSQSGSQHITFAIMVNGKKTSGFGGFGNDYGVVYLSTILDLSTTDEVQLMWKFFSGGSHNITIVSSNFLVLKK